jgi:hypothetical protein
MVPPKYLSEAGAHVMPPSTVFQTPPPVVPIQYSSGRARLPAAATERPPRNGPSSRQVSAASAVVSAAGAPARGAAAGAAWACDARGAASARARAR